MIGLGHHHCIQWLAADMAPNQNPDELHLCKYGWMKWNAGFWANFVPNGVKPGWILSEIMSWMRETHFHLVLELSWTHDLADGSPECYLRARAMAEWNCNEYGKDFSYLIAPWMKWPHFFAGDSFRCIFREWKVLYVNQNFTKVCF